MVNEELVLFVVQWRLYVVIIIEEIIYFTTFDVKAILKQPTKTSGWLMMSSNNKLN